MIFPVPHAPVPVVDELGAARDELAALSDGQSTLDRDTVLGVLRARIDRLVFGDPQ